MRNPITVILALLVAGLLGVILVMALSAPEPAPPPPPLLPADPETVQRIELTRGQDHRLVVERSAQDWIIRAPFDHTQADPARIRALLEILRTPRLESFELPAERLSEFDLEKPRVILKIDHQSLRFGAAHAMEPMRYAQHQDRLLLVHDRFWHLLTSPPEGFVNPRLNPQKRTIKTLHTPAWTLQRQGQQWRLQGLGDATQKALDRKARHWQHARAAAMVPAPEIDYQTDIRIRYTDGAEQQFGLLRQVTGLLLINLQTGVGYRLAPQTDLLEAP